MNNYPSTQPFKTKIKFALSDRDGGTLGQNNKTSFI